MQATQQKQCGGKPNSRGASSSSASSRSGTATTTLAPVAHRTCCCPPIAPESARSQMSAWQSSPAEHKCTALCGAQHTAFTLACTAHGAGAEEPARSAAAASRPQLATLQPCSEAAAGLHQSHEKRNA